MTQSRELADNASFAEAFEQSLNFKVPEQGDTLSGSIVSISGDDAYISYGGPTEAVISAGEVTEFQVGDTIDATVIESTPVVRLSRRLILRKASLSTLRQAFESRIPVEAKVSARNKGGFDVNVSGMRAFCPLSQIDLGKIENPDGYVGKTFDFRITEFSDDGKKLVVSRASILKEASAARAAELRSTLSVGAVVTGTVKTIMPFGAFVDIGGVEGLLHVSEMSRRRVNDPKEVVSSGQEVTVKVIKMDETGKRISLSMKDLEPDPWTGLSDRFPPGARFSGKVVRKTDFGLFIELEPGVDGLVHFSQLPLGVKTSDPTLGIGTMVEGWVREVDVQRKRLSLALREIATNDPWEDVVMKYPVGRVLEGVVERAGGPGVFVQIEPGLTGLIPISELSLPPGSDVSKAHQPGEKMKVKILSVDQARKRMALSHDAAKDEASHTEYMDYVRDAKGDPAEGKSALALALEKALTDKPE